METTRVEEKKKGVLDYLKTVHDIIDGVGTVLKTALLVIPAVVSLLSVGDNANLFNFWGPHELEIPNVYNLPQARGLPLLVEKGFTVTVNRVCSNSVGADRIREVLNQTTGAKLVTEHGVVTHAGRGLEKSAPLLVKVSNGALCS